MLGKFDVRLSLAVTVNNKKTWSNGRDGILLPTVDLVMLLDGAAWLWDEYGKEFEQNGQVRTEGQIKYITSTEPMGHPYGHTQSSDRH